MFSAVSNTGTVVSLTVAAPYYIKAASAGRTKAALFFGQWIYLSNVDLRYHAIPGIFISGSAPAAIANATANNSLVITITPMTTLTTETDVNSILWNSTIGAAPGTGYAAALYICFLN